MDTSFSGSQVSLLGGLEEVGSRDLSSDQFVFDAHSRPVAKVTLSRRIEFHIEVDVHVLRVAIEKYTVLMHETLEPITSVCLITHYCF